jgi:hypothetical protein
LGGLKGEADAANSGYFSARLVGQIGC